MAFNISRLKGGRPVTDNGDTEERHFVVDPNFDKEDGEITVPTTGSSDTLYFTNALINNSRTITGFSIVDGSQTSFTSSGGTFSVRIEGEDGARFTLTGFGGASGDALNTLLTIGPEGFIEEAITVGSTGSTNNRNPGVNISPDITETPETLIGDGVATTVSVSQTGVPTTPAVFSVVASAANSTQGTSVALLIDTNSGGETLDYNSGDIVTVTFTFTLVTGGNQTALASMSGFFIVPSVHGGDSNNYTWSLTQSPGANILSNGPESGTNRPTYAYHLREGGSQVGQSFTWSARIDTTGLGTTGSSFTGNFPIYSSTAGLSRRINFINTSN